VPIWGVEGSRTVAVDYFGSSYRVSSRFGAVALFIALTLLSAAWIGSLYMTRQRELILISRLEDYKQAFPHIINILPVVLVDTLMRARRKQTRKQIRLALAYNRIKLALFRSFVLLIIIVPMLAINVYCGIKLFLSLEYTSAGFMLFEGGILISGILAAVTIELVVQEWRLLWGKEFKE